MFSPATFNKDSPSIIYGEAKGRFGNQFLGYIVLLQVNYFLTSLTAVSRVLFLFSWGDNWESRPTLTRSARG